MQYEVLKMGHPLLSQRSAEVKEFNNVALDELVERLLEFRSRYQGAGLAAPQLGVDLQVICFGGATARYAQSEGTKTRILINPKYEACSETLTEGWEGCLSVPGLRGLVPRFQHIKYSGYDQLGNYIESEAFDFEARVIQHECDHINGILFPERIKDLRQFGFEEELAELEGSSND